MRDEVRRKRDQFVAFLQGELDLLSRNPKAIRFPLAKVVLTTLFNLIVDKAGEKR